LFVLICMSAFPLIVLASTNEQMDEEQIVEGIIQSHLDDTKIPGLAVVIVKGDQIFYNEGFGYADKDTEKKMTTETLFELGSVSKTFTAMGILSLREQGLINLDDLVSKHLPWLSFTYKGE